MGQMIRRETPGTGQVIHVLHDLDGNRLAEYDAVTGLPLIEYIWLEGEAVAAVIGGATYFLRSDHISRPVLATDDYGAVVQTVSYKPFGAAAQVQSAGLPLGLELRFPGQFAQWETGLHQNWMRDYDPTTGRYIQADPLGLVDGASVYGYALQSPLRYFDTNGLEVRIYSSDAWGISGVNHTYVYSTETRTGIGANGSSIVGTLGDGVTDLTSPYKVVRLPPHISESMFMQRVIFAPNWNNGLYLPFVNDCHNDLGRAFNYAGVEYPGAPNGRFDFDDPVREQVNVVHDTYYSYLMGRYFGWRR